MRRLLILTDEESEFLISKADFKNFTSMDVDKIKAFFVSQNYTVTVCKFSALNLNEDYKGVYILYQTSEAPGSFYKRYIEDLIFFLEKQGAIVLPKHELLKAHHDKIFMEFLRAGFKQSSLKTIKSSCYGSWVDAKSYNSKFPVVVKQISKSGGHGVFLANNRKEYDKYIKKAGNIIVAQNCWDMFANYLKGTIKKVLKYISPVKSKFVRYNTAPVSTGIVVQEFIEGLSGDYKVLIFGDKFYCMFRKNRKGDFRASGSGQFYEVPENEHSGLLDFAVKIKAEIEFPIIGMDIGFDGNQYHLFEFQMIHIGTSALHRSKFWHEQRDGKWIKFDGVSNLEQEFSRTINDYINSTYKN